ncbi:MAG: hypothetical protein V1800_06025 [Candidatus Latescibacterota bacterium]
MNDAETRAERIDPAIQAVDWGVFDSNSVRRHVITPACLQAAGTRAQGNLADYPLTHKSQELAVIEGYKRHTKPGSSTASAHPATCPAGQQKGFA